jgi:hypothetical protein
MSKLVIQDIEISEQLDQKALTSISGGSGNWIWGWISPHGSAGLDAVNLYNPIFNIQYANQTIINEGSGSITAINAPVFEPTTNLTEISPSISIQANIKNIISSSGVRI